KYSNSCVSVIGNTVSVPSGCGGPLDDGAQIVIVAAVARHPPGEDRPADEHRDGATDVEQPGRARPHHEAEQNDEQTAGEQCPSQGEERVELATGPGFGGTNCSSSS